MLGLVLKYSLQQLFKKNDLNTKYQLNVLCQNTKFSVSVYLQALTRKQKRQNQALPNLKTH